jgi:sialate O-acetylesterase
MPFLFVQLANYEPKGDTEYWPMLRAAQAATTRLPKTAMACTIDIGDAKDIHPKNKQDVGLRLALAALNIAYGKDTPVSGPVFKSMEVDGNTATLSFGHVGKGLVQKGDALDGFAVAGTDRKFVWAQARIVDDKVVVSAEGVNEIVAVRYGWADNPRVSLYNDAGLPAVPFRTDSW